MNVSEQAHTLIKEQVKEWQLAGKNYAGLAKVKTRKLAFDGFDFIVQFNPERIRSSAAKVDAKSISERPCFLCVKNRPAEQRGFALLDRYEVLVNPYPIFPEHLTIPHREHIDQRIEDKFEDMLQLARLLEDFTVFYNGPKCGASAPDHFHFQAGIKRFLPIEHDYRSGAFFHHSLTYGTTDVIKWIDYKRTVLTLSGTNCKEITGAFGLLIEQLKALRPEESEPMLNMLTFCEGMRWTVHIFPRKLHRPRQYVEKGAAQIIFSPASVDMGGVLITPREEDYQKLSMPDAEDMFRQVCLEEEKLEEIVKDLFG